MNKDEKINIIVNNTELFYNEQQNNLHILAESGLSEGEIRTTSGNLVEDVLQYIFDSINEYFPESNIVSNIGSSDYLTVKYIYKNHEFINNEIQVDRHVFSNNKRICFIENKVYLDACYQKRALADFKDISHSLSQQNIDPSSCKYIIFAGQNSINDNTMLTNEASFWEDTKHLTNNPNGLETKIFFFLKGKRSSKNPLFNVKHEFNKDEVKNFILYILNIL